jgi:hypothetical protein
MVDNSYHRDELPDNYPVPTRVVSVIRFLPAQIITRSRPISVPNLNYPYPRETLNPVSGCIRPVFIPTSLGHAGPSPTHIFDHIKSKYYNHIKSIA